MSVVKELETRNAKALAQTRADYHAALRKLSETGEEPDAVYLEQVMQKLGLSLAEVAADIESAGNRGSASRRRQKGIEAEKELQHVDDEEQAATEAMRAAEVAAEEVLGPARAEAASILVPAKQRMAAVINRRANLTDDIAKGEAAQSKLITSLLPPWAKRQVAALECERSRLLEGYDERQRDHSKKSDLVDEVEQIVAQRSAPGSGYPMCVVEDLKAGLADYQRQRDRVAAEIASRQGRVDEIDEQISELHRLCSEEAWPQPPE